jgi:MFS family permease
VRTVARVVVDDAELTRWTEPWRGGLVDEREDLTAASGPFRTYQRRVTAEPVEGGRHRVTSTVECTLAIPYWSWLFGPLLKRSLRKPGAPLPWWGPADHIDARASMVLGLLCVASLVTGYLGTLMTQTITYAADDFGLDGYRPQSTALAVARLSVVFAVALVALADRRGRRRMLVIATTGGCLLTAFTALAPNLVWYTVTQIPARGFATAIGVLVVVVAAEEMPKGGRAFGVSVLGMSAALGAGICVMALRVADTSPGGWRWLFLVPLLALPLLRDLARRLPESRRFTAQHAPGDLGGHANRLWLLAASVFLLQLFTAPASQLQNEFLRDERGYSALAISIFTVCTATPAGVGIVIAGHLADVHGRRIIGAVGLVGGVGATVAMFLSGGPAMWAWSFIGSIVGAMTVPALGVYGPELFSTGVRARANALLVVAGILGSGAGLLVAGPLSDHLGGLGPALAVLAVGPALLAVLVLARYPETAHLELEEINPEDLSPGASPAS